MIAAILPWVNKNTMLVAVVLIGGLGVWFVSSSIKHQRQAAFEKGVEAGKGASATATVASATETAAAERKAEAETPLPPNKLAIIALCRKSASCRERGKK